jgi:hypothetical protein
MTGRVSAALSKATQGVRAARRSAASASSGPSASALVLRLVTLAAGWMALLLAVPTPVYRYAPVVIGAAGVLAAAAALVPRRDAALVLELGVVALWLLPGGHPGPTAVAAVVLAVVLYVHHAAAALVAATGWDVRTTRSLARGWSMRTAATVVTASAISAVMLALTGRGVVVLPDAALLAGLAAAVLAVAVPLVRLRRPAKRPGDAAAGVSDPRDGTLD